jgi:Tfp pilus assembly protein PilN
VRPVNLIPPDQRRGDNAPLRTGPLVYIVVGALALMLGGVTMLVLASNEVSEKKSELGTLHREDVAAKARADELIPYAQFQAASRQRVETVAGLADSRFDWPRVMRELGLVLPDDVLLTNLSAGVGGSTSGEGGGEGSSGVLAPSLELSGCTSGQDAVARFVTALKDIDGVTRVGLRSSAVGGNKEGSAGDGSGCSAGNLVAQFELVIAFDAAPAPVAAEAEPAPEAEAEGSESDEEAGEESAEG